METKDHIGQDQIYNLLIGRELSWQTIILDLINTEQLDPWDIDLALLTQKYLEKVSTLEESSFYISSKVLLAAALLLRIKSEILIDRYIKSLDEILFGKDEEKPIKEFEFDLSGVSDLLPRTPIPRMKKVTLPELMEALEHAMEVEQRRIKKEVAIRHATKLAMMYIPKKTMKLREMVKEIYEKITAIFQKQEIIKFSEIAGDTREGKISTFVPCLHLDKDEKISLEQVKPFEEIFISIFKPSAVEEIQEEIKTAQDNKETTESLQTRANNTEIIDNEKLSAQDLVNDAEKKSLQ
jgi:segregation and condensation protein A